MKTAFTAGVAALLLVAGPLARADEPAEAGRRILKANQDVVVTVRLVIKYNVAMMGREQQSESKTETVGTVVDPSGLTVISLSTIDPSAIMKARGANAALKIDSELKDAKLVLADGAEIPAEVVLRDKDLDIAFVRPSEKPATPLAALDLNRAAKPQVLDQVICLNRLGQVANRVVSVSIERVDALVDKPRPFYVLSPGGSSGVGSPVFALGGAPLGVVLLRYGSKGSEANVASLFSGTSGSLGMMPIIVPASDIVEDAKQAMEAKKPAPAETK